MASNRYFGDDMTLSIETEDDVPVTAPVASLQQVTVTPSFNMVELYSADTTKRQDVKQNQFSVSVDIGVSSWDVVLLTEWMGGDGAAASTPADTTDPATFTVTGAVSPSGGGTDLEAVVTGVTFGEMPVMDAQTDSFIQKNFSGDGADITVTGPA